MKKLLTLTALAILFQLSACKDNNELSGRDQNINALTAAAWGNPTVMNSTDGDLSDQYADFIISFTNKPANGFDGTYVVGNGSYAFPESSGQWKFNESLKQIIFDSGKEMDVELSAKNLHLDFVVAPVGGRINGLSGHFTFDLSPR